MHHLRIIKAPELVSPRTPSALWVMNTMRGVMCLGADPVRRIIPWAKRQIHDRYATMPMWSGSADS